MELAPVIMEIGVLEADWDETIAYYAQVFDRQPEYLSESKVVFRTKEYDLYLVKLTSSSVGIIDQKFPPTYYNVESEQEVTAIYKDVLLRIPDATPKGVKKLLVFPVKAPKTSNDKAVIVTLASVIINPPATCKTQVTMELGVIHNPPYDN